MIEIIKKGTKEKCTCKICGCLFTYEEEDIKERPDELSPRFLCKCVICPQCNTKINIGGTAK